MVEMGLRKLLKWMWEKGYDKGYNDALLDVKQSMLNHPWGDIDWELELLR